MVICNSHNFIFLRIPKNASTSLATFFVKNYCDGSDIYTGINDSKTKAQNVPNEVIEKNRKQYHMIHMTLQELIDENLVSRDRAKQMEIIGVLRNPLERQLSLFFFKKNRYSSHSPREFREAYSQGMSKDDINNQIRQVDYLKIDGEPVGNFWAYEDIQSKLDDFVSRYGVDIKHPLQTYKSQFKPTDHEKLIEDYYDDYTRDKVLEYYKDDWELYQEISSKNKT